MIPYLFKKAVIRECSLPLHNTVVKIPIGFIQESKSCTVRDSPLRECAAQPGKLVVDGGKWRFLSYPESFFNRLVSFMGPQKLLI